MKPLWHLALSMTLLFLSTTQVPAQTGLSPEENAFQAKQTALQDRAAKVMAAETAREKRGDCKTERDTPSVNACMTREMATTDANYKSFTLAVGALLRLGDSPEDVKAGADVGHRFDLAEAQWSTYRKSGCDAVYQHYMQGTVRGFAFGSCMQTIERSHMREIATIYTEMLQR